MYVIAGVTGRTGSVVASTLLAARQPVRVIVRDAAKGAPWAAQGAEVAVASLDDRAALARALTGATGAYLLIPPSGWTETTIPAGRKRYADAILGAVADARPGHVVLLSSIGAQHAAGTGPIQYLHPVEHGLRAAGVPATFLRAAFFQENWGSTLRGALDGGTLYYALPARIPQVATADIGKTAARLLVEGAPQGARIVNLAGPADHDLAEVAATIAEVSGTPVAAQVVPPAAMADALAGLGASRELAEMYAEMTSAIPAKLVWEGEVTRGTTPLATTIRALLG